MRTSSQLLLNFLLNAAWQIALIAALASAGAWLLRSSAARYRHWLWVVAFCLAFLVPAATSIRAYFEIAAPATVIEPIPISESVVQTQIENSSGSVSVLPPVIQLNADLALILIGLYAIFLLYRSFKLVQAWRNTRLIKRNALELEADENIAAIINKCESDLATGSKSIRVMRSETLPVPVTMGLAQPVIILPDALLREGNTELLTSAIGHEFIHVTRNDYVLNFIYELLYLPLSFHPAAALLRRRIKQTRELSCDELVAARILDAEVYARSLLRLAGSAPALRQLSVTTTVGIADADILEARIMSLLTKPRMTTRWKKMLLVVVSILLLVPCVAAAAFNMRFDLESSLVQDPVKEEVRYKVADTDLDKQKRELATQMESLKAEAARLEGQRQSRANDPEFARQRQRIAEQMIAVKARAAQLEVQNERRSFDPAFADELERRRELERQVRDIKQAALVVLARINMDQAIQIANSQQPGKVMAATLDAKGWEEPGKLGKDGVVFYHVEIADEVNNGSTHVWVNAVDGTVIKTEKELPRKQRSPER
jgi:beta-lactamase regulating signal transducer with metallopeptidase domain